MKMRKHIRRVFAAVLVLCLGALPAVAQAEEAAGTHAHIWRTDWAIDDNHHWHGCADPACRTLVPSQAQGYGYHSYDNSRDPDCNVCGWVRAVDPGHTHTWTAEWDCDTTHHWNRCSDPACPGVVPGWAQGYGSHVYDGIEDPECNVCGRNRLANTDHTHTWGDSWSGDGHFHWRLCTDPACPGVVPGQAQDYGSHIYDGVEDPECSVCGRNRFLDPTHTHAWGAAWNGDAGYHWRQCTDAACPGVVPSGARDYGSHVYAGVQDTVCSVCGRSRYVDPTHTHTWGTDWSGDSRHHWFQCTGDGCPGVVPSWAKGYAAHVYDGELDLECNICGITRISFPSSSGVLPAPVAPGSDIIKTGRGWVSVRPANPQAGERVNVILIPEEHYVPNTLTITSQNGETLEAQQNSDGTWFFIHPEGRVSFHAVFLPAYKVCNRDSGCPAASYSDLSPDRWYHDGIHYCLDWGLMNGYDQSQFVPDERLSGGMIAQILYNLAGRPEIIRGSTYQGTGAWYDTAVTWAIGAGIMNTDGVRQISPREDITREQLAVMLWRYAGRPVVPAARALQFSDAGSISEWAAEAVWWAADRGILQGKDDNRLAPGSKITRAEAASMLVRFLESQRA